MRYEVEHVRIWVFTAMLPVEERSMAEMWDCRAGAVGTVSGRFPLLVLLAVSAVLIAQSLGAASSPAQSVSR